MNKEESSTLLSRSKNPQPEKSDIESRAMKGSPAFRKIEFCIFLSGFSCFAQLYLFQPILPAIGRTFGINPAESSFTVSFSTIGIALGLFTGVFLADRIPRKQLIAGALLSSSVLTILSAFSPYFELLLLFNSCKGFLLAGATSVAMAYIAEEVHPSALGQMTSLYVAGNAVGGMGGRIISTLITGWLSWHWSAGIIGVICLVFGLLFFKNAPESTHFKPIKVDLKTKLHQMGKLLHSRLLLSLYVLAGLIMGSFVSMYNYIGFRLEAAPFTLPHTIIALVYLIYIVGTWGSLSAGYLSDKYRPLITLIFMEALSFLSLWLLFPGHIIPLVLGLCLFTFCFFGAHATASRMVAQYAPEQRSASIALYLLFYYIGSSCLGSGTGVMLHTYGWNGFLLTLCGVVLIALLLALFLRRGKLKPVR